jgi:hypothetical protein
MHADNIDERIIRLGAIFVSDLIRFREIPNVGYEDEDKTELSMKVKNDLNILTNIRQAI